MPTTYKLIQSVTVGAGGTASINFSSIPSTYTDLCIKFSGKTNVAAAESDGFAFRFNGDTGANYSRRSVFGTGTVASSGSNVGLNFGYSGPLNGTSATNIFSSIDMYIPNYLNSNFKSLNVDNVNEANQAGINAFLTGAIWLNTAAITSISLFDYAGNNLTQYSTANLYGIKNS
jgi:hypothetical protein